ncbi:I78 family peptidase inhibitor [Parasphingorhabdus sp.]|uniref:I78 family peptidase inhibitor n=1 Tax=Parasphingorhabdus sp. TaxID=2709688 RepID=UPI0030015451
MRKLIQMGPLLALSACATGGTDAAAPPSPPSEMTCDASGLEEHVGHKVSASAGATLLERSGARVLRWVPPRTAVTKDYRFDRLTVSYDDDMIVTQISCG